jgi:urease beta subunit
MPEKKISPLRLNIYINDPAIRRQVKTAAAKQDISVSKNCLRAITLQLMNDGERPRNEESHSLKDAVEKARKFQAKAFGGRVFSISSADLIREARENGNIP